jgi:tripartite ATP-independent transporter DctM subunit
MSPELVTILMFSSMALLVALGLPLVFVLGGTAIIFAYLLWGPNALVMAYMGVFGTMGSFVLVATPLFIFMGTLLERSGIAEDMYSMIYLWMGPVRGGLAMGTVLICTIVAAMTGISGTAAVTMGIIALPSMLNRGYDKKLAMGSIMAGAALGPLIPPSVIFIVYGMYAEVSVGRLFAGGVFPGLLLSLLFCIYIGTRSLLQRDLAPALPSEARGTWKQKFVSLRAVILPALLIMLVLGSIFTGAATPTEAAGVGALGALICAIVSRKLSWDVIKDSSFRSVRTSAMAIWILFGATAFASVYTALGGGKMVTDFVGGLEISRWAIMIGMQVSLLFLGCFLDALSILMITVPVFLPIIKAVGFDPVWYGVVFCVNMELAYLTPPFGFNLFYMRGVAPETITMGDIYRSVIAFLPLQLIGLVLVVVFPEIIMWFPNLLFG